MTYSIEKLVYHLRGLYSAPIICELSKRKIFKFIKNKAIFDKKKLISIKSKKELEACLNYLIRINSLYTLSPFFISNPPINQIHVENDHLIKF